MAAHDIRRAANIDIKYNINEQFFYSCTVTDANGDAVNLSNKTLVYSIRRARNESAIKTATTASEIIVSGAGNNIVTVTMDSIDEIKEQSYYHDLENTTDNKMIFVGSLIAGYGAYGT